MENIEVKIDKDLFITSKDKEDEPFCFKGDKVFHFSPNLNCIIGGRGVGKSTLLNMIHRKLKEEESDFLKVR